MRRNASVMSFASADAPRWAKPLAGRRGLGGVRWIAAAVALALVAPAVTALQPAKATQLFDVEKKKLGPIKWKKGAKIVVYIPRDPSTSDPMTPRSRESQVQQAVTIWANGLSQAGIDLTLTSVILDPNGNAPGTNAPPKRSENPDSGVVIVAWNPNTEDIGESFPSTLDDLGGKTAGPLVGDDVSLNSGITARADLDNAKALAAALHEIGHALGLDHDEGDSVLHANLDVQFRSALGEGDIKELKTVYNASTSSLKTTWTPLADGRYAYTLQDQWLSGEGISLVQIYTGGADITDVRTPAGWVLRSSSGDDVLTFQLDPTETLQAYVDRSNPLETFTFDSTAPPRKTRAWAGDFQTIDGPGAPEPSTLIMVGVGLLGAMGMRRRARSP